MQAPRTVAPNPSTLSHLRAAVARIERAAPIAGLAPLPFGVPEIDAALPGGLLPATLHEAAGSGRDAGHGVVATLFAAGILARLPGPVLWVLERDDLFPPGLAAVGLHPDRVVYAVAGRGGALLVMEDGLRHRGLAGVVGEVSGRLSLTASRRLQLAAEHGGVMAVVLRRRGAADDAAEPNAAATRWRVSALPSGPVLPHVPDVPGVGRGLWRVDLLRCRGGRTGSWVMEACDASGRLGVVPVLADRPAASRQRGAAA